MKWQWMLALHGTERGTAPADTVYRGAMSMLVWDQITVTGSPSTTWTLLATDHDQNAIVSDGTQIQVSTDAGTTWTALADAGSTVAGLYRTQDGRLWGICSNGDLLRFESDLSDYSTITPGGVAVDCSTYRGIAENSGTLVAVSNGMNYTKSTDGGATWSAWSSAGVTQSPVGLFYCNASNAFIAPGASTTHRSTDGITWSAMALASDPAASYPLTLSAIELLDRVMLIADRTSFYGIYYTTSVPDIIYLGVDLSDQTHTQRDNFLTQAYQLWHDIQPTIGDFSAQTLLRNTRQQTDGVVNFQNAFYTKTSGALWWGWNGVFYNTHFGRWPDSVGGFSGNSIEPRDWQFTQPFFRLEPLAIRALAPVEHNTIPKPTFQHLPNYEDWLT